MRLTLRSIIAAAFVVLCLVTSAHATGSLSFSGGGYWVDLEIGQTDVPVVASVRFHRANDSKGVILPRNLVVIEMFDTERQVLVLRFIGTDGVEPFSLSVKGGEATLQIDAQRIVSQFSWRM